MQIAQELCEILGTDDIAIIIDAQHLCVSSRGVQDVNSSTITAYYGGDFMKEAKKNEFLQYLNLSSKTNVKEVLES